MTDKQKIGAGHASAMARMGLRELRGAIYPGSNVAQQPELGVYGTATPHEVFQERHGESDARESSHDIADEQGSVLESRMEQAQARDDMSRDDRDMGRD